MAYNLGTVRDNVRNRLDDEDFELEYLDRAINYAQWEITNHHHLNFMEKTGTISSVLNDIEATLPTDHHKTLYLRVTSPNDKRLDITDNWLDYGDFISKYINPVANPIGMPCYWAEYSRKIKYAWPLDGSYTLTIDYLRKSTKLENDSDVPDIPEEFQELLELGAYMRIAKREDDYDVKSQEQTDYDNLLVDMLHVYGRKQSPRGIRKMRVR